MEHSPPPPTKAAESGASLVSHHASAALGCWEAARTGGCALGYAKLLGSARGAEGAACLAARASLFPSTAAATQVRMGFPRQNAHGPSAVAFVGPDCVARAGGYKCPRSGSRYGTLDCSAGRLSRDTPFLALPASRLLAGRCKARVADIPSSCHICRLTLVSSPHLARSYHHLFPVPAFVELSSEQLAAVSVRLCWASQTSSEVILKFPKFFFRVAETTRPAAVSAPMQLACWLHQMLMAFLNLRMHCKTKACPIVSFKQERHGLLRSQTRHWQKLSHTSGCIWLTSRKVYNRAVLLTGTVMVPRSRFESRSAVQLRSDVLLLQGSGGHLQAEEWRESGARVWCFGCLQTLAAFEGQRLAEDPGVIVRCPDCLRVFCFECDAYVHESLHNCPGCECLASEESQMDTG